MQGRASPWLDAFTTLLVELSNETWNWIFSPWTFGGLVLMDNVTGVAYSSGQVLGLWHEYVYRLMRASPYWTPAVEAKARL